MAGPTLIAGARLGLDVLVPQDARAAIPSPDPSETYDLTDLLTDSTRPTANLVTVTIGADGRAAYALPRAEVGQGLTTAIAMIIADELDLPIDKIGITLSDARPELVWNQLTGGSNSVHALYTPVRVAAAVARNALLDAAAIALGIPARKLTTAQGVVATRSGRSIGYGELAPAAAVTRTESRQVQLRAASAKLVGTPQNRIDARDIVTGRKQFAMDLDVPGALPTMVCRPPTINGTVKTVNNAAAVKAMPGITDVVVIPNGVAVRGATFGQCIDAVRALSVTWNAGTEDGKSDSDIEQELLAAELPIPAENVPLGSAVDVRCTFAFASNSPLETNCAVADVRADRAEIWSSMKMPIVAQEQIARALGLGIDAVTCHVTQGGGSFGRHLFYDAALEAALASQAMGKPVKLMWHRTDDFRQGRLHGMSMSRVRIAYQGTDVLSYDQRHTSVSTDFKHGFGELISATLAEPPGANLGYARTVFNLSQNVPYAFGPSTQLLNEVNEGFNTGSMRNIYSPNVTTVRELAVDQLATAMQKDPLAFRLEMVEDDRMRAVLEKLKDVGQWGRSMAPGTAQGVAIHSEYKGRVAVLVELDCTPATVNRPIVDGFSGPRVTKAVCVVDVGLPINPRGLEAQMLGGMMDGIGLALTFSVHLADGHLLEGSWDNTFYTRQWNVPRDVQIVVMPQTTDSPGGAGELGVPAAFAAVACAYARATGTVPAKFPINHDRSELGFEPLPTVPPIPASPTDGLARTI